MKLKHTVLAILAGTMMVVLPGQLSAQEGSSPFISFGTDLVRPIYVGTWKPGGYDGMIGACLQAEVAVLPQLTVMADVGYYRWAQTDLSISVYSLQASARWYLFDKGLRLGGKSLDGLFIQAGASADWWDFQLGSTVVEDPFKPGIVLGLGYKYHPWGTRGLWIEPALLYDAKFTEFSHPIGGLSVGWTL